MRGPCVVDARRLGELGEAAVALRVGMSPTERDMVEEALRTSGRAEREPRRDDAASAAHPEARVRGEEHVARLDERELLGEREVERVERRGRVRPRARPARRGRTRSRCARRRAACRRARSANPGSASRISSHERSDAVQRAVGGAARGRERERGAVLAEPLTSGGARGGRQLEPEQRVRRVRERREAGTPRRRAARRCASLAA